MIAFLSFYPASSVSKVLSEDIAVIHLTVVSLTPLFLASLYMDRKNVLSKVPSISRKAPRVFILFYSEASILLTTSCKDDLYDFSATYAC